MSCITYHCSFYNISHWPSAIFKCMQHNTYLSHFEGVKVKMRPLKKKDVFEQVIHLLHPSLRPVILEM